MFIVYIKIAIKICSNEEDIFQVAKDLVGDRLSQK